MISSPALVAPDRAAATAPALPRVAAAPVVPPVPAPPAREMGTVRRSAFPAVSLAWALQLALAAFFLFGGVSLLGDVPAFGADFELMADLTGAGAPLRLAAGAVEALGGLLLLLPTAPAAAVGAVLLGALMAAAAAAYAVVLHAAPVLPGVLLALLALVAYARRRALAEVGDFLVRNL